MLELMPLRNGSLACRPVAGERSRRSAGHVQRTVRNRAGSRKAAPRAAGLTAWRLGVDDHGAMLRARSSLRRGRWRLFGAVLLLLTAASILAARGGAQDVPRP